jgi:hypothetical protein
MPSEMWRNEIPLTALFSGTWMGVGSVLHFLADLYPAADSIFFDKGSEDLIFLRV